MRGALAGIGVVLVVSVVWAVYVLVRSWVGGDFDRPFPACDPCGFTGYAGRMLIVTGAFFGIAAVPAAVAGWLIERLFR
jgi:hypothetical protein